MLEERHESLTTPEGEMPAFVVHPRAAARSRWCCSTRTLRTGEGRREGWLEVRSGLDDGERLLARAFRSVSSSKGRGRAGAIGRTDDPARADCAPAPPSTYNARDVRC